MNDPQAPSRSPLRADTEPEERLGPAKSGTSSRPARDPALSPARPARSLPPLAGTLICSGYFCQRASQEQEFLFGSPLCSPGHTEGSGGELAAVGLGGVDAPLEDSSLLVLDILLSLF